MGSSWLVKYNVENTEWQWVEVVHTFGDTDPNVSTQDTSYKRLYFYFFNNNVAGSSLDMCGFKMERVNVNTGTARNFLRETEHLTEWTVTNGTTISNGVATFPIATSDVFRGLKSSSKNINYNLIRNKPCIISMKVKASDGDMCCIDVEFGVTNSETNTILSKYTQQYIYFTGNGNWQTVCLSEILADYLFTSNGSAGEVNFNNCWFRLNLYAQKSYHNSFQVKEPQLSLGTSATDWTPAPEDIEEEVSNLRTDLQAQIDEKIQTYYQATAPSWSSTTDRAKHDGDLWYCTETDVYTDYKKDRTYRYDSATNTWIEYSATSELFDKLDGKTTVYYGTTSGTYENVETGDYLVDGTDGSSYRWDGSKWVKVTDYKTAIDNIEVGGRNLIIGTLYPKASGSGIYRPHIFGQISNTTGRGTYSVAEHGVKFTNTSANWQYIYFGASSNTATPCMLGLEAGETYTLSADLSWKILSSDTGKANTTTYYMGAFLAWSPNQSGSWGVVPHNEQFPITQADKGTNMSGKLVYTFTVPETAVRLYLAIRANNTNAAHYAVGDYIEAKNLKLEKGNKATSWTPAPEDYVEEIEDAKKVATNYLSMDSTGIMVADMNDGEQKPSEATGRNVFIDNDSVDIRNGTLTLASFTGDNTKFYDPVYKKELATFGTGGAIIGANNEQRFVIEKDSVSAINENGAPVFSIVSTNKTFETEAEAAPAGEVGAYISGSTITLDAGDSVSENTFYIRNISVIIGINNSSSILNNVKVNSVNADATRISYYDGSGYISTPDSTHSIVIPESPAFSCNYGVSKTTTYEITANFINDYNDSYNLTCNFTLTYNGERTLDLSVLKGSCTRTSGNNEKKASFDTFASRYSYTSVISSTAYTKAPAMTFGTRTGEDGMLSSIFGQGLYAEKDGEFVIGRFNEQELQTESKYAFIVGNGEAEEHRSNALTIDWSGNICFGVNVAGLDVDAELATAIINAGWDDDVYDD